MTSPVYARAVAELLARRSPNQAPAASDAARAAGIAAVQRAIASRRVRRRMIAGAVITALTTAAAAMLLLLPSRDVVVQVAELRGAGATLVTSDGARPAQAGGTLASGAELVTADAGAIVTLSTGTRLALARATRLEVRTRPALQRFALHAGALHADVAHVPAGEHFSIVTPDAEVEVHGTSFRVEVGDEEGTCPRSRTRVIVDSGVVSVRHGAALERLVAGMRWPPACPAQESPVASREAATSAAPEPKLPATREPARVTRSQSPAKGRAKRASAPAPEVQSSTLAEQNDTYSAAMLAARRGDPEAAIASLSTLLERYPDSALAESAAAMRLRLLMRLDRERARSAAQQYLVRFPSGSAVVDAARVLETAL